tara:strand:- start:667 stop:1356 length:690 start_codon:yes stop_codon:yes gene_type:complete
MTSIRSHLLLALFAFIAFVATSSAQEKPEKPKKTGSTFTAIALSSLPYEHLYYRNGREFIEIEWRNGRRSKPFSLSRAKALEVYIDHNDPKNPYLLVGKAAWVPGTQKMLYFFGERGKKREGQLPLNVFGIDDSETAFPESSFRFINFIRVPLLIDFNKKRFLVKPGKPTVKKLNLTKDGAFIPFVVSDSEGQVLGGTRLFGHALNRKMVLIFPPKKGKKRLDIRCFSD